MEHIFYFEEYTVRQSYVSRRRNHANQPAQKTLARNMRSLLEVPWMKNPYIKILAGT